MDAIQKALEGRAAGSIAGDRDDGVYGRHKEIPRFYKSDPITDSEVATLIERIALKGIAHLKRKGYLDQDGTQVVNPELDPLFGDNEAIHTASVSSLAGTIAFGPNAGKYVTRIGSGFGYEEEIPLAKGRRCYAVHGFSLHANTSTNTHQRERLEKLIQYMARGPLSSERVKIRDDGQVLLRLKRAWADGTTHLLFTPSEFIEKLSALIPPPRAHLVDWAGVFAPNSPYRQEITLRPEIRKGFQCQAPDGEPGGLKNSRWARMLARLFKIDISVCENCGSSMRALGALIDPFSVALYRRHVGLEPGPKARGPPRTEQPYLQFDTNEQT